jgi:hypothetical protein
MKYVLQLQGGKTAEAAQEVVSEAQGNHDVALANYEFGVVRGITPYAPDRKEVLGTAPRRTQLG